MNESAKTLTDDQITDGTAQFILGVFNWGKEVFEGTLAWVISEGFGLAGVEVDGTLIVAFIFVVLLVLKVFGFLGWLGQYAKVIIGILLIVLLALALGVGG